MALATPETRGSVPPRFRAVKFAAVLLGGAALAAALAWIAVAIQPHFAPLGIFPLLVGAALGLGIGGLVRVCQVGHRGSARAATAVAVVVLVVGQHYESYRLTNEALAQQIRQARREHPGLAGRLGPIGPASFGEYLQEEARAGRPLAGGWVARGAGAWCSWAGDALLTALAAWCIVAIGLRQPYCDRCGSWMRTMRAGEIPPPSVAELASVLNLALPPAAVYCRLRSCRAGCGPVELTLEWQEPTGDWTRAVRWLDGETYVRVLAILS